MIVSLTIYIGITVYLVYYNWYLINDNNNDDDNHNKNKKIDECNYKKWTQQNK